MVSEPARSCPDQNPVNYLLYSNGILSYLRYLLCYFVVVLTCWLFSHCMRHVQKYCRYLFWCSVLLGGSEQNGRVAAYSRCCRGIFWREELSWLWLWFRRSMRSFREVGRVAREAVHWAECFSVGCSSVVGEEEGW